MKASNQKFARHQNCDSFYDGFCTKQQHFTMSSAPAHCFFTASRGSSNQSLKNYGFINNTIFKTSMHTHKRLAIKQLLFKIAELCAWRQGKSGIHCWLSVWREPGLVNDSSANTTYIYWGSLQEQTCCSVIDGNLQPKHASAAKKKVK